MDPPDQLRPILGEGGDRRPHLRREGEGGGVPGEPPGGYLGQRGGD